MRLTEFESRRVDELAPATLASYKTKAGAAATAADAAGDVKTADRRFSGIVKATKKQFDQDAKGMSEDSDDTVRFEVDSENAYNHVMDQFGSVIDWDGDTMVVPRKYWGAIQELALAASGEASEEQGLAENYPKHQDLSGISTDKLKAYVAKYTSHPMSGEGAQVRRVRAELERRSQGMAEGSAADGSVNYTLGHTPDAEYVYHIYRDGKKEGTYHSVDQAREIMGNMMLTRPNREYKIKRGTRNKMAGPTGQLPEQGVAEGSDRIAANKQDRLQALENKLKAKGYARTKDSDGGEYQYRWTRDGAPSYVVNYRSGANGYAEFRKEQGVAEADDSKFVGFMNKTMSDKVDAPKADTLAAAPAFYRNAAVSTLDARQGFKNALKFGLKALSRLDSETRQQLAAGSEQEVEEYLTDVAERSGQMGDDTFVEEDLSEVQDYLSDVFHDPSINSWKDVLQQSRGVAEDDDAVAAFLARGGEIQQLKPQRGPKRSGVGFASKHIGSASGRGNTKGKVSGLGANTGKASKPVVTAEQHMAEGSLNEARDARIKRIQELSEGLSMNDLAKVPMFVVDSFKKAAFATEREAIETKNAIKTVFNWSQSTPEQKQAAKKQMHDIAKIAAGLAIAGAVGHVGAAALGVGHAATTVGAVAQTAIEHIIADLGIEAVAGILGAGGINIVKNALHDITTSSGHEFEKQQYQQGVKQRIKTQPMAGPAGHLPEQTVAEDALAGMKRLAGIAPITTQTTPGQRQYRHMPTAVQSR